MVAAVIPAAGASCRMRFPKGALRVGGSSLLELQCDALFQHVERLVVVVGWASGLVVRGLPEEVEVVEAPRWWTGTQADSVRLALARLPRGPVLVQPSDVPPPSVAVVEALLRAGGSAVPSFQGRRGHPVLLGCQEIERLRVARLPEGLRTLLRDAREVPVDDPRVTWNLNHPRELARWLRAGLRQDELPGDGRGTTR